MAKAAILRVSSLSGGSVWSVREAASLKFLEIKRFFATDETRKPVLVDARCPAVASRGL
jgi:hypothetical protein